MKDYRDTQELRKASRKLSVWGELLFGKGKGFHRLRSFRLRGLHKVNIEGIMIAAGQNLKSLIKQCLEMLCSLTQYLISHLIPAEGSTALTPWWYLLQGWNSVKYRKPMLIQPQSAPEGSC